MMHETFARLTSSWLTSRLRAAASLHVVSVDQLTFEEFIRSLPNPATFAVVNMEPLAGSAILEIAPEITFAIIDRLCGGRGEAAKISRELTDIEISFMESVIVRFLGNLRESWSNVIDLRPRLGLIETNPQFAQIIPPDEIVLLITLEAKVGEVEGMSNLCIPYTVLEPVMDRFSAQYNYPSAAAAGKGAVASVIEKGLFHKYNVFNGVFENMTIDEMRRLKPGVRIPLKEYSGVTKAYKYAGLKMEVSNG